jgi:hypothetical protein
VSPALLRRRALQELVARPNLTALTEDPFHIPVPKDAAYARAVLRLRQWQERQHATTFRAWLSEDD